MKVSIVVPTLGNRLDEIRRLINSLTMQQYKNFEVVVISQENHEIVSEILKAFRELRIVHLRLDKRGLSYARNHGIAQANGEIILLSDDDCWYHSKSLEIIVTEFLKNVELDILLTKIHDFDQDIPYKKYSYKKTKIKSKYSLLSKSSIEIAYKKGYDAFLFDEKFGLGATFSCCEEIDFLITNFDNNKTFFYVPEVTVFHPKKRIENRQERVIAKGAIYAKHFNWFIGFLVVARDLLLKRENNLKAFMKGYSLYKRSTN
ncbi:glycosyltransferase family 2 protein [Paenibacillus antri]|uniref:Glycosyltransferase family 2 protein n=1 Tax=Paenibacillus antri TaxID=2582848 RepID=A0A5R9G6I6_9BACL|nr:glycosyltransferase family 2 protein [Paenibacillus antri]TLS51997.1 glycosyltransferase family 2 protein [Paenibacillus antri]